MMTIQDKAIERAIELWNANHDYKACYVQRVYSNPNEFRICCNLGVIRGYLDITTGTIELGGKIIKTVKVTA